MKKLLIVFGFALIITSCSIEETDLVEAKQEKAPQVDAFINGYFSESVIKGKSVIIESQGLKATPIYSETQNTPVGYILTDVNDGAIKYFMEVNLTEDKIVSLKYGNKVERDVISYSNFIKGSKIDNPSNFNFMNLIPQNDINSARVPFWGERCTDCFMHSSQCYKYRFWIRGRYGYDRYC